MLDDAMETVILRHNFFSENAGWGLGTANWAANHVRRAEEEPVQAPRREVPA